MKLSKPKKNRKLDLQAQIFFVLVGVIVPTFILVTFAQYQFFRPVVEEEIKQIGIASAKNLASEILNQRLLHEKNANQLIESRIQELIYSQPNIIRMDVMAREPTGAMVWLASNVEQDPQASPPVMHFRDSVVTEYKKDSEGVGVWEIFVPIMREGKNTKKIYGNVFVLVSMRFVNQMIGAIWKTTASAAVFSVVTLIIVLSVFLRRTISNERLLKKVEDANLQLTEKLHEAQRQLMNTEKLAVMGQLTASFAHEIGTPLNAIGGHLQLLGEEIPSRSESVQQRLEVINGQLGKIESIVKSFLQSTAKPSSQRQLVDLSRVADQVLSLVKPRADALGVEIKRVYDRKMGPIRAVPLDIEQIVLNLLNNSLDSLRAKQGEKKNDPQRMITVSTQTVRENNDFFDVLSVHDTGQGIRKDDLLNVLKPFFTTKSPGEGTGLGLAICQELAKKYGGMIWVDSKEGAWTKVTLKLPHHLEKITG